jgi:hypothetical protein
MNFGRPPTGEWSEIAVAAHAGGAAFIYYADDLSRIPTRAVTKPNDNKSDPNFETGTFGLFSTCGRRMRTSIVRNGTPHVFFLSRTGGGRALAGYYRMKWQAVGVFGGTLDYCLAADVIYWIEHPIPVRELQNINGLNLSTPFRGYRLLTPERCEHLYGLLIRRPDASELYVREVCRLEHFNLTFGGYRYVGWRQSESFGWEMAGDYLGRAGVASPAPGTHNSSITGMWRCVSCGEVLVNTSLLKRCPICGLPGTLVPHN